MADRTKNESITEVLPQILADYLKKECKSLKQTIIGFPEPNLRLRTPCVSVYIPRLDYAPSATPYKALQGETQNNQAQVNWVVGDYEATIKLDLWAANKEELDDVFDQVFNCLNPTICPTGFSLVMEDYFDQCANLVYIGHDRVNNEQDSKQDNWRITLDVLAACNAIRSRKEYIIGSTEVDVTVCTDSSIEN